MMRYVVSDSGSVTSAVAWPLASVTTEPIQKASTRKSFRIVPGSRLLTAAAAFVAALRRQHAAADDALPAVGREHLQRLAHVDGFRTSGVWNAVSDSTP